MKILVTGTAGFIGFHLAVKLAERGDEVIGLDNINAYYDVNLKYGRLKETGIHKEDIEYNKITKSRIYPNYSFIKLDLKDREHLNALFKNEKFNKVCNLAAQAGVRYSLQNPYAYIECNIDGFINILECCRLNAIEHLVYASSSSVYGLNESMPFSTHDNVDHPVSLYAATKKSNELMAHTYSYIFQIPTTGLRYFTVYGPWGRPDMALFIFTKAILGNKPINVFNNGNMQRDFTYIDDIISGTIRVIDFVPRGNSQWDGKEPDPSSSVAPYKVYNIGSSAPVNLMDFINTLEKVLGKKARKKMCPLQDGDVPATYADIKDILQDFEYRPATDIQTGINNFICWYRSFYNI